MIPQHWHEGKALVSPDERITLEELAQLHASGRGQYTVSDTREFVHRQEQLCATHNCWMTRSSSGEVHYWRDPMHRLHIGTEIA